MKDIKLFPMRSRKNIRKLVHILGVDAETAYVMMVMAATLMDLRPEDDAVVEMILMDCEQGDCA